MIRAIIFDFDGVIVESTQIKTKAFEELFCHEGFHALRQILKYHMHHAGVSRFDKFVFIYKNILKRKLTRATFKDLCKKFSQLVAKEVINAPYVLGAEEFLRRYKKQYKFFVISATPQEELLGIIKKRAMCGYFKNVYGAPTKKNILVRRIIHDNKLAKDELVYIGDALSDYEAAKANSIVFIARVNNNKQIFDGKGIFFMINDLSDLKNILKKLAIAQK